MMVPSDSKIETFTVEFLHRGGDPSASSTKALDGVSVSIAKGEFVAVVGRNGSGKTTFARLLNGLLLPTLGVVRVNGIDTLQEARIWDVRRLVGMVFQDPDSQIIGTTVAEDVAFGPQNLGLPASVIQSRVRDALHAVAMEEHACTATHLLSSVQKLRVSLAGVVAMQPDCILLDEASAMLDPGDRKEIMTLVRAFNREKGMTIVQITHDMEEAARADRVIVFDHGKIALDGKPAQVFSNFSKIKEAGLDLPHVADLFYLLNREGLGLPVDIMDTDEAIEVFKSMYFSRRLCDAHQH